MNGTFVGQERGGGAFDNLIERLNTKVSERTRFKYQLFTAYVHFHFT